HPPPALPGATAAPAAAAPPPLLSGPVLSPGSVGTGPLVQTAAGTLALPAGLALPRGQTVWLEVVGPPAPPPLPPDPPVAGGLGRQGWPALSEALSLLSQNDAATAALVRQALPQPGPGFAVALAQFVLALRKGGAPTPGGSALTEALDRAGRRDLASRIDQDLGELADEAREPRGADGRWQALTVPLLLGGQIEPVRLFVHRPGDGEEGEEGQRQGGGGERRFLIEIDSSRFGRMQFDGLVVSAAKRFDLIIRTGPPLAAAMRQDIAEIFAQCAELTGAKGGISFQAGRGFVEFPPPPPPNGTFLTA
ncbi:DNA polymerase III, partial [Phaeospirillum tilakii]